MLDRIRKDHSRQEDPLRNPAEAAKLLAELRTADPPAAMAALRDWLDAAKDIPAGNENLRNELLALVQEASEEHLSRLLAQFHVKATPAAREPAWNALNDYLRKLTVALCSSARVLLKLAGKDRSLQLAGAAAAARGLHSCRMLAKLHLLHYQGVPSKLWQLAYAVHSSAEKVGGAVKQIRMHAAARTTTTATQELLRLLMLQSSAPEMMPPEQIEVADRVIEQLGGEFALHPRGAAGSVFCFDPAGDQAPRRSAGLPRDAEVRYFDPGAGYEALERLHRDLAKMTPGDIRAFGKEIPPHVQMSAIRHLMAFWGVAYPYAPPVHSQAAGALRITRGYAQVWQLVSRARPATLELSLEEDGDGPAQAPEAWALQDAGGNELGAGMPPGAWARSGDLVGVSTRGDEDWMLGVIRSMRAGQGRGLHANIFILSRSPQAVQLRPVIRKGEASAVSDDAARQFAYSSVRAIILSEGATGSQAANFLLPPESWEEGRIYEGEVAGADRQLRGLQLLRRGDDYVRATFEWVV